MHQVYNLETPHTQQNKLVAQETFPKHKDDIKRAPWMITKQKY